MEVSQESTSVTIEASEESSSVKMEASEESDSVKTEGSQEIVCVQEEVSAESVTVEEESHEERVSVNVSKAEFECQTTIVITEAAEAEAGAEASFVTTKEIVTQHSEAGAELGGDSQQLASAAGAEQEKNVENGKIISLADGNNDADQAKDRQPAECLEGEAEEQNNAATPDLIKTCNEINTAMNNSNSFSTVNILFQIRFLCCLCI